MTLRVKSMQLSEVVMWPQSTEIFPRVASQISGENRSVEVLQEKNNLLVFEAYAFSGKRNFGKDGTMLSLWSNKGTCIAYGMRQM